MTARNAAGWELCLVNLDTVVGGEPPPEFDLDAWRVLFQDWEDAAVAVLGERRWTVDRVEHAGHDGWDDALAFGRDGSLLPAGGAWRPPQRIRLGRMRFCLLCDQKTPSAAI